MLSQTDCYLYTQQHLLSPRRDRQQEVKIMQVSQMRKKKKILDICQKLLRSIQFLSLASFMLFYPILEKMLEKEKMDTWKWLLFLLHLAFLPLSGVYLHCTKEKQGSGSCRRSDSTAKHSQQTAGNSAVSFWLLPCMF